MNTETDARYTVGSDKHLGVVIFKICDQRK